MFCTAFLWINSAYSQVVVQQKQAWKLAVPDASAAPTHLYSHGNPTNEEQYLLELTNRARANPSSEGRLMVNSTDEHILSAIKAFHVDTSKVISDFDSYSPKPPLAFNAELFTAARAHSQDMADNDFQGHISSDGRTLAQRLTEAGYAYVLGGENVFAYAYSAWHAQAAFLIDWGVDDLGHRQNILDLGEHTAFREIGIGIISETDSRTTVGPLVITQEFGLSNNSVVFITGVVYRDTNQNRFYDPGEGLSAVRIMPDHGEYYAMSSESGGFAIPVAINSGEYILTATRSDLPMSRGIATINSQNVKIDFPLGDPQYATISGKILNGATGQSVSGVAIRIDPIGVTATSDANGEFIFSDLPATSYKLHAELENYSFQPNDFTFSLTAGQSFQARLTATRTDGADDSAQGTEVDDSTISTVTGLGCPMGGLGLTLMLTLAFRGCLLNLNTSRE